MEVLIEDIVSAERAPRAAARAPEAAGSAASAPGEGNPAEREDLERTQVYVSPQLEQVMRAVGQATGSGGPEPTTATSPGPGQAIVGVGATRDALAPSEEAARPPEVAELRAPPEHLGAPDEARGEREERDRSPRSLASRIALVAAAAAIVAACASSLLAPGELEPADRGGEPVAGALSLADKFARSKGALSEGHAPGRGPSPGDELLATDLATLTGLGVADSAKEAAGRASRSAGAKAKAREKAKSRKARARRKARRAKPRRAPGPEPRSAGTGFEPLHL